MAQAQLRQETLDAFIEQRVEDRAVQLRTKILLGMVKTQPEHSFTLTELDGERCLALYAPEESSLLEYVHSDESELRLRRTDIEDDGVVQYLH